MNKAYKIEQAIIKTEMKNLKIILIKNKYYD